MSDLLCVGKIVGVHGIRGLLKVKIFTDTPDILLTDDVTLSDKKGGKMFEFLRLSPNKDHYLGELDGIKTRNQAEELKGIELYVSREALPEIDDEDEFYHVDLIDMMVTDGEDTIGKVVAVQNFGAGDLLEVKPPKGNSFFLPFTKTIVPSIDFKTKTITAIIPDGLLGDDEPEE